MKENDITQEEEMMIEKEFEALLSDYAQTRHRQKTEIITKAYLFAKQAHNGVRRRSGEPYIMHPLAVARIVVKEIGLGSTSICSALLHDVVEDTEYTTEDIEKMFGPKIASIVDGLTKIAGGVFGQQASSQAENFRKLILTMSEDIRVILIKIADRLHNMRTLEFQPVEKQFKIAGETLYIYAPLAHRLGLFPIKTELENLSFKYEHPAIYNEIAEKLAASKNSQMETYETFIEPIKEILSNMGYEYQLEARIKSPYSIWEKMKDKNIQFEDVYDLLAVRIIFTPNTERSEKDQCWMIYSALTEIYTPHPERIRDWISTPKSNGYEALHVTVMGQNGNWIEVQIRTTRMHEIAEKGLAAHWKYKMGEEDDSELDRWLRQIKELLKDPEPNAMDFLDTFKLNLFASEIFVFTPHGEIKTLPLGATTLDFAYMLHTEIGEHCIGAKVNHTLQPLSYELRSGDQIEILTDANKHPQAEWLQWVTTAKAKSGLENYFKREDKKFIHLGEEMFEEELTRLQKKDMRDMALHRLLNYYGLRQPNTLMREIGKGSLTVTPLENLLTQKKSWWRSLPFINSTEAEDNETLETQETAESTTTQDAQQKTKRIKHIVLTEENEGLEYQLAPCCHPIPGDDVLAYQNPEGMFIVHKVDCPEAQRLKSNFGKRISSVEWRTHRINTFEETIEIQGIDRRGIMMKVMEIISKHFKCNLTDLHISAHDGIFIGKIRLHVFDRQEIESLCDEIRRIKEVNQVQRLQN